MDNPEPDTPALPTLNEYFQTYKTERLKSLLSDNSLNLMRIGTSFFAIHHIVANGGSLPDSYNLAADGFRRMNGHFLSLKFNRLILSPPTEAEVIPLRPLRPSEKTELIAGQAYQSAQRLIMTGGGGYIAAAGAAKVIEDKFEKVVLSSGAAVVAGIGVLSIYFGIRGIIQSTPRLLESFRCQNIGIAIPRQEETIDHNQAMQALSEAKPFLYE